MRKKMHEISLQLKISGIGQFTTYLLYKTKKRKKSSKVPTYYYTIIIKNMERKEEI